ncbi:MAG: 2-C-methyl-D-erythritol 4-phosphate cytidylyltransferase [Clostridia bacterium]
MKASVIIPAAGKSSRMKSHGDKCSLNIQGIPVLIRTIGVFFAMPEIHEIVVALPKEHMARYAGMIRKHGFASKVKAVAGADDRTGSVANAFRVLEKNTDMVLVHDGARPFVTEKLIRDCIGACAEHGAAVAGIPSKDTVKLADSQGFVKSTPDRRQAFLIQTPQAFRYGLAEKMMKTASSGFVRATDDASLAEALGHPVFIVPSDESNMKITTDFDLVVAEAVLSHRDDAGAENPFPPAE